MKKLNLITEFDKYYKGSDLQKIVNNKPLPIKYTINNVDCFFYNADLFGLFDWKITKDGLTTNDFIKDYKDGFIKGLEHLKEIEKIKIKNIKNTNTRANTILQIQNILFEREFQFGSKGLINLVFIKLPLIFTEKNIYDYGYWNGIIHSIDNLCEITGLNKNDLETDYQILKDRYKEYLEQKQGIPPQPNKNKHKLPNKIISFKNPETIEKLHIELKGYFPNKDAELLKVLQGEQLTELLLFPHNQNRFVEVFKRLKYNGFVLSTPTEIKDWICSNFNYVKTQGQKRTVEDFKENSVWDVLTKAKCEPSKKNRICELHWLPFIKQDLRKKEAQKEQL